MEIPNKYLPIFHTSLFLILIPYSVFMCWIFKKPLFEFVPMILCVFVATTIISYIHLLFDPDFYNYKKNKELKNGK